MKYSSKPASSKPASSNEFDIKSFSPSSARPASASHYQADSGLSNSYKSLSLNSGCLRQVQADAAGFQADQKQRHRAAGEMLNEFAGHFGGVGVGVFDNLRSYCSLLTGLFMARSYLHPKMKS
jgi:hypothetical protein